MKKIAEDLKYQKNQSEGNVNEVERLKAFVGTYDERASIEAEGGMQYGIDHRVSREFIPAGPPRQKTELHVPTYSLRYFQVKKEYYLYCCITMYITCILVFTGLYWSLLVFTGLYWSLLVFTCLYLSLLVCTCIEEELSFGRYAC